MQKLNEKKILGTVPKNYQDIENFWDCPEFSRKQQNQKGITLIALIITMIVMLILVGVTINVALNGGLFEKAEQAVAQTNIEKDKEMLQNIALGFLETNGEINFAEFETEYAGKTVEGYKIKDEGEYVSATKGETIFYINKYGGISEEKPTEKVYTFTLNELKEGGYTTGDSGGIGFDVDYLWNNVIGEDLSTNEKYTFEIEENILAFGIESSDGNFTNYWGLVENIENESIPNTVNFIALATFNYSINEFEIPIFNHNGYQINGIFENGRIAIEDFLNEYGDVEFRFVDISSIEIPE